MDVKLLAHTPDALRVAFTAIRTCYSDKSAIDIWEHEYDKYEAKANDHIRLVKQIVEHGHTSTLEHITFTFSIEGVSRALLAQLTRHRIGFSYSVQSQRYVKFKDWEYTTPDSLFESDVALAMYDAAMLTAFQTYRNLLDAKVPAEDARMVLPNATTTKLIVSFNLRAFLDFYSKRNFETHSQEEISDLAELLKRIIVKEEPWIGELF